MDDTSRNPHPTVLVVDDEPVIRELISMLLEDEGYSVRQAADGLEALQELASDGIDLVLSDIKMPHLDGVSLARQLCSREPAVPVVLMCAAAPGGELPDVPFLRKPFAPDHLTQVIADVLARNGPALAMNSIHRRTR
jgi:CheY-like chemotaxis protein